METEDEVFSEAGFGLDEFAELYQLGTGVFFALEYWLEDFNDTDSVTVDNFKVFEVIKGVGIFEVQVELTFILGVFLQFVIKLLHIR